MIERLSQEELDRFLESDPTWSTAGEKLVRKWTFGSFPQAIEFVVQVAELAEKKNHHPDIDIRYKRVILTLWTHDTGGLTRRDTVLAAALTGLIPGASGDGSS